MSNQNSIQTTNLGQLKTALSADSVSKKFQDMLGKKSAGFMASITNAVQNNTLLQKADVNSIILAASQAAALDLPINGNLGYAALIPYNDRKNGTCTCQFQIQRNGWVELLQRTGTVSAIANECVYDGELVESNRFTGTYKFDETKKRSDKIIGYMAYVKLTNGFEKTVYMTVEECKAHGMRYSQTMKKGYGLWVDAFDAMAKKTVLKNLIVKYLPKSIEMLSAIESDQASFSGDINNPTITYIDNPNNKENYKKEDFVEAEEVVECDNEKVSEEETKDEF